MEKELVISGKKVKFKSSAAVLKLYRREIGRDLLIDMARVERGMHINEDGSSTMPVEDLEIFEDLAYIFAKHADPENVPPTPDEWLEQFEALDIYAIYPELINIWAGENVSLSSLKKKKGGRTGSRTRQHS